MQISQPSFLHQNYCRKGDGISFKMLSRLALRNVRLRTELTDGKHIGIAAAEIKRSMVLDIDEARIKDLFVRFHSNSGSAIAAIALRSSAPCVSAAPQKMLLSTSTPQCMPHKMPEEAGKVRFGFIPEEWFQFMYKKTGVTGPYVFGTGLILFLLNKEIYVLGPETVHAAVALSMFVYGIKRFGPGIAAWADKKREEKLAEAYEGRNSSIAAYKDAVEHEKTEQWRLDGRKMLFDARRENVAMRMEIEYRERLQKVADGVKKKLDYHVELENTKRRLEQQHMVRWIEQNVVKSITPQQEKEIMNTCISNLKSLAATA